MKFPPVLSRLDAFVNMDNPRNIGDQVPAPCERTMTRGVNGDLFVVTPKLVGYTLWGKTPGQVEEPPGFGWTCDVGKTDWWHGRTPFTVVARLSGEETPAELWAIERSVPAVVKRLAASQSSP